MKNIWDRLANNYLKSIVKDKFLTFAFEKQVNSLSILSLCTNDGPVLDLGCGDGRFTRQLEARFNKVVAVDNSEKLLKIARKICQDTKFIKSDLEEDFPQFDTKFNLVTCKLLLMYIKNIEVFARNSANVLNPQGELVISVTHPMRWVAESNRTDYLSETEANELVAHDKNLNFRFFLRTFSTYVNTFTKYGFHLETVLEPGVTDSFMIKYHPRVYDQVTPYRLNLRFVKK